MSSSHKLLTQIALLFFLLVLTSSSAQTSSLTLASGSAAEGGSVTLNLSLNAATGSLPTALQWTLSYAPGDITTVTTVTGAALTTAGKTVTCNTTSGAIVCLATGMNNNTIGSGVVALITAKLATFTSGPSVPLGVGGTMGALLDGSTATVTGTGGTITVLSWVPAPVTVNKVTCSPLTVITPGSSACTVTLNSAAPSGGSVVTLASSKTATSVPASVTVPSGSTTANFTATSSTVSATQTAVITASVSGSSATVSLTLQPAAGVVVSSLLCNPSSVASGSTSACTVTLSQAAPSGGATVALSSSSSALTVPVSILVPSGSSSAGVTATAGSVSGTQTATVTASLNGKSVSTSLSILSSSGNPGLVAAYGFGEGTGTTVSDVSGKGNTGQISGATWTTSGKYGTALVFNGTSARVNINDSTSLHLTTSLTLEAWVNPSTVNSNWRDVIYKGDDDYFLEATSTQSGFPGTGGTFGSSDVPIYGTKLLTVNTWAHLAATYDGATLRLYVNGVQVSSLAEKGNILTSSNQLQIGGDSIYGQYFKGTIDEVRVYNTALTAAQIQSDMNTPIASSSHITMRSTPLIPAAISEVASAPPELKPAATNAASTLQTPLSGLSCAPRTVSAGAQAACELRTNSSATPLEVRLATNSPQVRTPTTVRTRPNQSNLTFLASVDPVAGQQSVVVSAMFGGAVVQETLLVTSSSAPVLQVPARQLAKLGEPVRFNITAVDPAALPVQLKANGMPSGTAFDPASGHFEWVPNTSQAGNYRIAFTATNSARQSSTAEVTIEVDSGRPVLTPSDQLSCSPSSIASLSGKWLAQPGSTLSDPAGNTTNLGGTRVSINGVYAPLLFASADQVKFLCPAQNSGTQVFVAVENHSAISKPLTIPVQEASPTILSLEGTGQNQGIISFADSTDLVMQRNFQMTAHPAQPGDSILIWATGLGSTVESGSVLVKLGDTNAQTDSIQAVPGYAGVYCIQVHVPASVNFGDGVPVQFQLAMPEGRQFYSNRVTAAIEPVRE